MDDKNTVNGRKEQKIMYGKGRVLMKISSRDLVNVDSCVNRIRKEFKKGVIEDLVRSSAVNSVDEVKMVYSDFVKAAIEYIEYAEVMAKRNYRPLQYGKAVAPSELKKAVNKTFTVNSELKKKIFFPEWYELAQEDFMYNLLERLFDASIILEQSAERRLKEMVDFYNSMIPVTTIGKCFFVVCEKKIFFINVDKGVIYEPSNRLQELIREYGIKDFTYNDYEQCGWLYLNNRYPIKVMSEGKLNNECFKRCDTVKDNAKEYLQLKVKTREDSMHPAIQFPIHTIMILAERGINVAKFFVISDSFFTCDHLDMQPKNNSIFNLQLVTRRDNIIRAKGKDPIEKKIVSSFDFGYYFNHIAMCDATDKKELKFRKNHIREVWEEKLVGTSAKKYLLGA